MKYHDYLKTLSVCPFCKGIENRILLENDSAILTYALAPYHKYHLMVIPKRHVERIIDLNWDENVCITALIVAGIKALSKLGHDDCTLLARDNKAVGKSVAHLHYHIIPGGIIADTSLNLEVRKMLLDGEELELKNTLNEWINQ